MMGSDILPENGEPIEALASFESMLERFMHVSKRLERSLANLEDRTVQMQNVGDPALTSSLVRVQETVESAAILERTAVRVLEQDSASLDEPVHNGAPLHDRVEVVAAYPVSAAHVETIKNLLLQQASALDEIASRVESVHLALQYQTNLLRGAVPAEGKSEDRSSAVLTAILAWRQDLDHILVGQMERLEEGARIMAEAGVAGELNLLRREKDAAEAVAEARLAIIDDQKRALAQKYRWRFATRLRQVFEPRIGVLYHYEPRPLLVPGWYTRTKVLTGMPRISIVTPTRNQGHYLERTLRSVLDQRYERLEYVVQDGASSDQTLNVLEKYSDSLARVVSEPDDGFACAINRGFSAATGDILAYLNSDDLLLPGTLNYVAAYFEQHPDVDVVYGHRILIDEYDQEIGRWVLPPHDDEVLSWADYVPQETLFWRRGIWERIGSSVDESFKFAVDWDLLLRFRDAGAKMRRVPRFLAAFRVHPHQKTSTEMHDNGKAEMERLRERALGRRVTTAEIGRALSPYLRRHFVYHKLYRLGLLRY